MEWSRAAGVRFRELVGLIREATGCCLVVDLSRIVTGYYVSEYLLFEEGFLRAHWLPNPMSSQQYEAIFTDAEKDPNLGKFRAALVATFGIEDAWVKFMELLVQVDVPDCHRLLCYYVRIPGIPASFYRQCTCGRPLYSDKYVFRSRS